MSKPLNRPEVVLTETKAAEETEACTAATAAKGKGNRILLEAKKNTNVSWREAVYLNNAATSSLRSYTAAKTARDKNQYTGQEFRRY